VYEIEKGIAPRQPGQRPPKLPFEKMEVGDSFLVPFADMKNNTVKTAANRYSRKTGFKISVFKEDGGSRVFRLNY